MVDSESMVLAVVGKYVMVVCMVVTYTAVVSGGITVVVENTDCPFVPEALLETIIVSETVVEARVFLECLIISEALVVS